MPHSISIEQFCAFNDITRSAKYIFNNVLHNCWTQGLVCWCYLLATNVAFYRYFIHSSILGKVTIQKKHFKSDRKNSILESNTLIPTTPFSAKGIAFFVDKLILIIKKYWHAFTNTGYISMYSRILCAKSWYRHCPSER